MSALPLNKTSGMPQMGVAFAGWANTITIYKRSQKVIDGLVSYRGYPTNYDRSQDYDVEPETYDVVPGPVTRITFRGVIQPLSPKLIALKPEGQRAWEWLQIHCLSGPLNLTTDDQIIYNCLDYKVMGVNDYVLNGFIEYHCIKDYQNPAVSADG